METFKMLPQNDLTQNELTQNKLPQNDLTQNDLTQNDLPQIALNLICEYSRPITCPDWRNIRRGCVGEMYKEIMLYKNRTNKYDKYFTLYNRFILNVQNNYTWQNLYEYVKKYGLDNASEELGINKKVLCDVIYQI